jgi:hypothetical protein
MSSALGSRAVVLNCTGKECRKSYCPRGQVAMSGDIFGGVVAQGGWSATGCSPGMF